MADSDRHNILLLTLVHPDFLPPVYAAAQTLRKHNYNVHILTFDSLVKSDFDPGESIVIETLGKHHNVPLLQRIKLKRKFSKRAELLLRAKPKAIVAFCPFSYLVALKYKDIAPVCYIALEVANYSLSALMRSPLSTFNNFFAIRKLGAASFLATPSAQRSAWLAGRGNLQQMPHIILNSSYYTGKVSPSESIELFSTLVPPDFVDKQIIIYTGNVNSTLCVEELLKAFILMNDPGCRLIITGIKSNNYSNELKRITAEAPNAAHIKLLPYVTRNELICIQENAHIGACLFREESGQIKSKMIAPNKLGEYLNKGLFVIGIKNEYMNLFEYKHVAFLTPEVTSVAIAAELKKAVVVTADFKYRAKIDDFVSSFFSMQQQLKPLVRYLADLK